ISVPLDAWCWGTTGTRWGSQSTSPPLILTANGPNSSTEKNRSFGPRFARIDFSLSTFSRYCGSLLVTTILALAHLNPVLLLILRTVTAQSLIPCRASTFLRSAIFQVVRLTTWLKGGEWSRARTAARLTSSRHFAFAWDVRSSSFFAPFSR